VGKSLICPPEPPTIEHMNKTRVYIVIRRDYETGIPDFRGVFFSKKAVEAWIAEARHREVYEIETYEETENGEAKEVFD
jgi:rRNA processing protein Krr1/Pno1